MSEKEKKNKQKEENDSQTNSEKEKERERILKILQENLINFPHSSKKKDKDN